jgi:D-arabinose 1-dehydrogenase-like Zn-dependent alcohol dehydrogenase
LFCAGATVFSPLTHFGAGPGKKVGIVGIGGLGHLGLKFARALGAEVYAISTSASKEEEAKKLGAHHFINTNDKEDVAKYTNSLDLIVCTANGLNMDWNSYLNLLCRDGTFTLVGAPEAPITLQFFPLLFK